MALAGLHSSHCFLGVGTPRMICSAFPFGAIILAYNGYTGTAPESKNYRFTDWPLTINTLPHCPVSFRATLFVRQQAVLNIFRR